LQCASTTLSVGIRTEKYRDLTSLLPLLMFLCGTWSGSPRTGLIRVLPLNLLSVVRVA
jgi:hypothetical protein